MMASAFLSTRPGPLVAALVWAAALSTGCVTSSGPIARPAAFPGSPVATWTDLDPKTSAHALGLALALRGSPYTDGGETPTMGFDCSGLVRYVFLQEQIALPRTVALQYGAGRKINRRDVRAGDLLFFATTARTATHVGIAIDLQTFVHAPGTNSVVRTERFDTPYWNSRLVGVRRISAHR